MAPPPINILIVEDNLSHQKITEYVLRKNNVAAKIHVVRDGQEILDYLFRRGEFTDAGRYPLPQLILLDLNLPKHDGREVLKLIKSDPALREIPVVVVSTSDREEDVTYARENGAAAYISKASGFDKFNAELGAVLRFARPAP